MTRDQKVEINGYTYMVTIAAKRDILAALGPFKADSVPWNYVLPVGNAVKVAEQPKQAEGPVEVPGPAPIKDLSNEPAGLDGNGSSAEPTAKTSSDQTESE